MRLAVVLVLLAVLVAACEDKQAPAGPTPTAQAETHEHEGDFNQVIRAGAERAANAGFKGTYRMTATANSQQIQGEVTWHRSGPRARADFIGTVDGQDVELRLIAGTDYPADDLLYACWPAERRCIEERKVPGGDYDTGLVSGLLPFRVLDAAIFAAGLTFYDESARSLLDEEVLCFVGEAGTQSLGIDHGEVCLTEAGLPLLVTASGGGTTVTLSAFDVPGAFGENAFDLPFPLEQG